MKWGTYGLVFMYVIDCLEVFINNIEKERVKLNYTQSEWAKKLNMSLSAYKRLISGRTMNINIFIAKRLYKLTGKFLFELFEDNHEEFRIISKLKQLTPRQLKFIKAIIDFESDFKDDDFINAIIPTGNMCDAMIYDSCSISKIKLPDKYKRLYNADITYAVEITSNHLHPAYNKGDILFLSNSPPRDGDTAIFINKNTRRAYIRKFFQGNPCRLVPVNNYNDIIYVDSDNVNDMSQWIKFGTIITKVR